MIKKGLTLLVTIILGVSCMAAVATGDSTSGIQLTSSKIITNDINSTYITGTITSAQGQEILVKQGFKTIVTKILPTSGKAERFMIKIPPSRISTNSDTFFRVMVVSGTSNSTTDAVKVKITYKPRKNQSIQTSKKSYNLTFPGVREPINAKSSSGQSVMFVSENPNIVIVDDSGNLVPVGEGTTRVSLIAVGDSRYESAEVAIVATVKEIDGCLVTFHASTNGQSNQTYEQVVSDDTGFSLDSNMFENGSHHFLGWACEEGGLVEYSDGENVKELAENKKSIDLYAVWTGDGAIAAVAWAKMIAADNSFAYGYRPHTARAGCYFCGTNQRNKPKGYEKTYVCMTFVQAAYAHGAENPEMLADCQGGRLAIGLNDWNFSHYSCWKKVGRCSQLSVNDLEPGDVIIWWADDDASGHASIYAGGNDIVDAAIQGWYENTIAIRYDQAQNYLRRGANFDSRSYVMRYVPPEQDEDNQ